VTPPITGDSPERRAALQNGRSAGRATSTTVVIIFTILIALALRAYLLVRSGPWAVTQYDDGPYLGSAVRLAHGVLPYRDYSFVQPPGITLLMCPAGLASYLTGTAWSMVLGRVLTVLAGAASVLLTGLLVRHRGSLTTLLACGIVAVYPPAAQAAHTVLLEPWLVLSCMAGAVAVFDGDHLATASRRLAWGGIALGFAGAIKTWAIVPVIAIAALCLPHVRRAAVFLAGVAAGFLIPVVPFALAAPRQFSDTVVVAQLARVGGQTPALHRFESMLGVPTARSWAPATVLGVSLAVVALVVLGQVGASLITRRLPSQLDWFATGSAALVVVIFLWPPYFAAHYAAFLAPFLGLAIALAVGRMVAAIVSAQGMHRADPSWRPTWQADVVLAIVGAGFIAAAVLQPLPGAGLRFVARADRVIPSGACVATDQASFLLLANRFISDVPGCTQMVDGLGTDLALSAGRRPGTGAGEVPAVAAAWRRVFNHADYVLLSRNHALRIAWTPQLLSYFHSYFREVLHRPGFAVYKRAQ
jgi:Glycosyltransferase family 87